MNDQKNPNNIDCAIRKLIVDEHQCLYDAVDKEEPSMIYIELGLWLAADSHCTNAEYVDQSDAPGTVGIFEVNNSFPQNN